MRNVKRVLAGSFAVLAASAVLVITSAGTGATAAARGTAPDATTVEYGAAPMIVAGAYKKLG